MQPVCFSEASLLSRIGLPGSFNRSDKYHSLSRLLRRAARDDKFKICAGFRKSCEFLVKATGPIVNRRCPNVCSLYVHLYSSSSYYGLSGPTTVLNLDNAAPNGGRLFQTLCHNVRPVKNLSAKRGSRRGQ
jgi:hypothetical protein